VRATQFEPSFFGVGSLEEGRKIVDAAWKAKIPLRLIGGVAIRVHSGDFVEFAKKLSRLGPGEQEYTGLDFMSYVKFRDALRRKSASVRHHNSSSNRPTCNLGIVARDGEITYMSIKVREWLRRLGIETTHEEREEIDREIEQRTGFLAIVNSVRRKLRKPTVEPLVV
jgi:hypothetical protein